MSFKEALQRLSTQVLERKDHINNEETTKQSLIIPFLQVLGYDVFNPLEIRPEYVSDIGKKKGEKVDYAILNNEVPIIFIEAKSINENLNLHGSQLARYFNATPNVKLAILTNGITYKFFTDIEKSNIMDEDPFAVVDITQLSLSDIEILSKFKKDTYETEALTSFAEDLIYTSNINNKLRELFKNPPDDFVRYLIKDFSDTRITNNVLERFRPIVKKAISSVLLEIVTQGLIKDENLEDVNPEQDTETFGGEHEQLEKKHKREIITTQEELDAFETVKNILSENNRDISQLFYKDTVSYFAIYKRVTTNWLMRLVFDTQNKYILTKLTFDQLNSIAPNYKYEEGPKSVGGSKIYINSGDDLSNITPVILACYDNITNN